MAKKIKKVDLKNRLLEVFKNWLDNCDESDLQDVKTALDEILDEWNGEDRFGTEGQLDPRGDCRNIDHKTKI